MTDSYEEFRARLCRELASSKKLTPWMLEVGYRPEDKDMGLARWQELTGATLAAPAARRSYATQLDLFPPTAATVAD